MRMVVMENSAAGDAETDTPPAYMKTAVPTANGRTIPAISLSALISLRIFAKVANNFLTLHRYA